MLIQVRCLENKMNLVPCDHAESTGTPPATMGRLGRLYLDVKKSALDPLQNKKVDAFSLIATKARAMANKRSYRQKSPCRLA
jgi:hypothetical protein